MDNIKNKVALVTGASRGIGKAIALALADEGVHVAVNYRSSKEEAEQVAALIRQKGSKAVPVRADVSEAAQVTAMLEEINRTLGKVDILINNAGIAAKRLIEEFQGGADRDDAFLCQKPRKRGNHRECHRPGRYRYRYGGAAGDITG